MMVYPIGEKPILKEPYYTFFKIFKEQPWDVLVAIGHSFRDLPVNVAILENLQKIPLSRLIIVNKEPEKAFNNLTVIKIYNPIFKDLIIFMALPGDQNNITLNRHL